MSQFETCLFSHGRRVGRWALTTRKFPTLVQFNLLFLELAFFLATFLWKICRVKLKVGYNHTKVPHTLFQKARIRQNIVNVYRISCTSECLSSSSAWSYLSVLYTHRCHRWKVHCVLPHSFLSAFPMWLEFDFLKWKLAAAGSSLLWGNGRPLSKNFDTKS